MVFKALEFILISCCWTGRCDASQEPTNEQAFFELRARDQAPSDDVTLGSFLGSSEAECAVRCLSEAACTTFTWNTAKTLCNTFRDTENVISSPGAVLYTKMVTPTNAAPSPYAPIAATTVGGAATEFQLVQDCEPLEQTKIVVAALRLQTSHALMFTSDNKVYKCEMSDILSGEVKEFADLGSVSSVMLGAFSTSPDAAAALIMADVSESLYLFFKDGNVSCFTYDGLMFALVSCLPSAIMSPTTSTTPIHQLFGSLVPSDPDAVWVSSWGNDAEHWLYFLKNNQLWSSVYLNGDLGWKIADADVATHVGVSLPLSRISAVLRSHDVSMAYVAFHEMYMSFVDSSGLLRTFKVCI